MQAPSDKDRPSSVPGGVGASPIKIPRLDSCRLNPPIFSRSKVGRTRAFGRGFSGDVRPTREAMKVGARRLGQGDRIWQSIHVPGDIHHHDPPIAVNRQQRRQRFPALVVQYVVEPMLLAKFGYDHRDLASDGFSFACLRAYSAIGVTTKRYGDSRITSSGGFIRRASEGFSTRSFHRSRSEHVASPASSIMKSPQHPGDKLIANRIAFSETLFQSVIGTSMRGGFKPSRSIGVSSAISRPICR